MNFSYRDDQLLVRDTVRDFVRSRIVPNADAWNEKGEFPLDLVPELAALGLTGLAVPHEYAGAELDVLTIAMVMEELGAGDGSVALTIAAHNSLCIGHLLVGASEEQKARWLPPLARGEYLGCWALTEPSSGSDAISAQSRARRDGDDYVLTGTKQFITNGSIAGFGVILVGAGERKLTAFGVPREIPGLRVGRREEKMGPRPVCSCTAPRHSPMRDCVSPTRRRRQSSTPLRQPRAPRIHLCRFSAGTATCRTSRSSGICGMCVSWRSARVRARSSGS